MSDGKLTPEILDQAFRQMKEQSDRALREQGERAREVVARGPWKSWFGQILDSAYIRYGPLIVSPQMAKALKERLEREEAQMIPFTSLPTSSETTE